MIDIKSCTNCNAEIGHIDATNGILADATDAEGLRSAKCNGCGFYTVLEAKDGMTRESVSRSIRLASHPSWRRTTGGWAKI